MSRWGRLCVTKWTPIRIQTALVLISLIWRGFRFKAFFSTCKHIQQLYTLPIGHIGHMYGHFLHLIQPIAVQCAGPSWQPLWGSPTLPWPTCTLTVGSGAGFYTMLRLAAYKTSLDRAIKQGKRHSSSIIVYLKHTDFFYSVVKQKKKRKEKTRRGCLGRKVESLH